MLDCLVNYVGIKGCGEALPGSGLYVNDLPGIPRELLDKIATADQGTYKQAWLDIQNNAVQEMNIDLKLAFANRYKSVSLLRSFSIGKNIDTTTTEPQSAEYRGFSVDIHKDIPDGYVVSNMIAYSIDALELYIPVVTTNPITIRILDGDTAESLFSYSLAVADQVTGWNVIPVNSLFYAGKIVAVYDATEVDSVELTLAPNINDSLCGCLSPVYDECLGEVKGIDTGALNINTINEGTNTYGLTANISLTCTYEKLVCRNKMLFAKPLQYLLGYKVLEAALYTNRFGRFNTTDRKVTEGLAQDYRQDYLSALELTLKGIDLDQADPCIVCDPALYTTYVRP